jgi:PKD repeat protein
MLFMLRLIAIAAFIFAANLNLFAQQDTSGWVQSGNVWFHKQSIGVIHQSGLSSTGDSLWTFSDDNGYYFRIWDLKSGMMVYEKTIVTKPNKWPYIAKDMKSVIYLINPAEFEIYELQTNTLIKSYNLYDITREKVAPEVEIDFNASLGEVYYAQKRGMISQGMSQSSMSMQVYLLDEGVKAHTSIGPNFVYNNDFSCIAGLNFSHRDFTNDKIEYSHSVSFYNINSGSMGILYSLNWNNNEKYRKYNRLIFTSKPNLLAGFDSEFNLTIWDWKSQEILSHSKLKNFSFGSICFTENDEYIAGARDKKIFLYDLESKNIIDSTDVITNDYIKLLYSKSKSLIVFHISDRLGIFDSKFLSTEPHVEFIADSTLVYTGQPVKLYNKSNFEYDSIEWELSDGRTTFNPNPTFTFDTPGMIDVSLKLTKDGKIYSIKKENYIEVYPLLKPDFEVDVLVGDAPLTVQFENTSQGIITEYIWKANNVEFSREINPQFTFIKPGDYNISLSVTDKYNTFTTVKKSFMTVKRAGTKLLETVKYSNFNFMDYLYDKDLVIEKTTPSGTIVYNDMIIVIVALSTYSNSGGVNEIGGIYSIVVLDTALSKANLISNKEGAYDFTCSNTLLIDSTIYCSYQGWSCNQQKIYLEETEIKSEKKILNKLMSGLLRNVNLNDSNYIFGGLDNSNKSIIIKMDKENNQIAIGTLEFKMIDLIPYSNEFVVALTHDSISKSYYYIFIPSDLENQTSYKAQIPEGVKINCILKIPNDLIAFGGTLGNDSIGVLGVTDIEGKLIWMKTFPLWQKFDRLYQNRNNFFATGYNTDRQIGFIESNPSGTDFSDYRKIIKNTPSVFSLIPLNENTVLLSTHFGHDPNLEVSKYNYTPLPQAPVSVDNSAAIGYPLGILPAPNPAENSVTLQFAEAAIVQKVQVYDYSGIEVMQFTLPQSPVYEVQLPLHALSIGIYHVTVTTDSGILRTKFIKY